MLAIYDSLKTRIDVFLTMHVFNILLEYYIYISMTMPI